MAELNSGSPPSIFDSYCFCFQFLLGGILCMNDHLIRCASNALRSPGCGFSRRCYMGGTEVYRRKEDGTAFHRKSDVYHKRLCVARRRELVVKRRDWRYRETRTTEFSLVSLSSLLFFEAKTTGGKTQKKKEKKEERQKVNIYIYIYVCIYCKTKQEEETRTSGQIGFAKAK